MRVLARTQELRRVTQELRVAVFVSPQTLHHQVYNTNAALEYRGILQVLIRYHFYLHSPTLQTQQKAKYGIR